MIGETNSVIIYEKFDIKKNKKIANYHEKPLNRISTTATLTVIYLLSRTVSWSPWLSRTMAPSCLSYTRPCPANTNYYRSAI